MEAKRANVGGSVSGIFLIFLSRESNIFQSWNIWLKITLFRHASIKILPLKYNFSVSITEYAPWKGWIMKKEIIILRKQDWEESENITARKKWRDYLLQRPYFRRI